MAAAQPSANGAAANAKRQPLHQPSTYYRTSGELANLLPSLTR